MAEQRLGPDVEVIGAFHGFRGPRPGIEVVGGLVGVPLLILTHSRWFFVVVVAVVFAGVTFARRHHTVIRTTDAVLLIDHGRRSRPSADANVTRLPPDSITVSDADGDPTASIGHLGLWLRGDHQDEARRLSRLARR